MSLTTVAPIAKPAETQEPDDLKTEYATLVGQQVLFYPSEELFSAEVKNSGASFLGFICHVNEDRTVTLACFDRAGASFPADYVPLVTKPDDAFIASGHFAILRT